MCGEPFLSCVRSDAASGSPSGRCRSGADASRIGGCKRNGKQSLDFSPPSSFGLRRAAFATNLVVCVQTDPFCQGWPASRSSPASEGWRRGSESNRRMRLLQSPALPLGYPATRVFNTKFDSHAEQVQSTNPNLRRCSQSSFGLKIPTGVMMPVINSGGVTSKPGFRAPLVGFATRI